MKNKGFIFFTLFLTLYQGCIEPYEIESEVDGLESVLVVEGTITNEMKRQVIKLSRSTLLDDNEINIEKDARIRVKDDIGNTFSFSLDSDTGHYLSDEEFMGVENVSYALEIQTLEGKDYSSETVTMTSPVPVDSIYAQLTTEDGEERIKVFLDSDDPNGDTGFFRYEYEETYQIVAPRPSFFTAEIINDRGVFDFGIRIIERDPIAVCYKTEDSAGGIVQTSTAEFDANRVVRFPVRSLKTYDPKIIDRYSIVIKQYVQDKVAYDFYRTLQEIGSFNSILSQSQPGFVIGNMSSIQNPNEKVIGFFEASAVSISDRIYFDFQDFDLPIPPYFFDCPVEELFIGPQLRERVNNDRYQIIDFSPKPPAVPSVLEFTPIECSICTSIATDEKPDFWEDE